MLQQNLQIKEGQRICKKGDQREREFEKPRKSRRISISQNDNVWQLHYQRISLRNNLNWKSVGLTWKYFQAENLLGNIYNISILVILLLLQYWGEKISTKCTFQLLTRSRNRYEIDLEVIKNSDLRSSEEHIDIYTCVAKRLLFPVVAKNIYASFWVFVYV